jgi:hypothetical protein
MEACGAQLAGELEDEGQRDALERAHQKLSDEWRRRDDKRQNNFATHRSHSSLMPSLGPPHPKHGSALG